MGRVLPPRRPEREPIAYLPKAPEACDKRAVRAVLAVFASLVISACAEPDPRFSTPEKTVESLFEAYGVADVPEREIQRRLLMRERFELVSRAAMLETFADYRVEEQEGLTGFVFGRLVARKASLTYDCSEKRCEVRPEGETDAPPVVLRKDGGEWKIVLAESVPPEVQRELLALHRRADELRRRGR